MALRHVLEAEPTGYANRLSQQKFRIAERKEKNKGCVINGMDVYYEEEDFDGWVGGNESRILSWSC